MAGIWERIKNTAENRVGVHLLEAAFVLKGTNEFTGQQIIDAINEQLATPLTAPEIADLDAMAVILDAQATTTLKLVYLEKIKAATICAEMGSISEAKFKSILGLV